jgi:undecaprenyl diphosphate synthase
MQLVHLGVIPDGNRRYAKKHSLSLEQAYSRGFKKAEDVLEWAAEQSIKKTSFWALSLENLFKRSTGEKRVLFSLMEKHARKSIESKVFQEKNVKVKFFGKLELLPKSLVELLEKLEEKTENGLYQLNVALAYGGREELANAAKLFAKDVVEGKMKEGDLSEETFANYLYLKDSPDLLIRTGGVQRISGFLPFQSVYSEYYFSPKLWPEFDKQEFGKAVEYYYSTDRRFGK